MKSNSLEIHPTLEATSLRPFVILKESSKQKCLSKMQESVKFSYSSSTTDEHGVNTNVGLVEPNSLQNTIGSAQATN